MLQRTPGKLLTRLSPVVALPAGIAIGAAIVTAAHDRSATSVPEVSGDVPRAEFTGAEAQQHRPVSAEGDSPAQIAGAVRAAP